MTEAIDTEVKGNPDGVRALAADLRNAAAPVVDTVADTLVDARRGAEDTWLSPAGDAFHSIVSDAILPVDGLANFLRQAAGGLDLLAGEVEQAQSQMTDVRIEAAGAGLTVSGFAIEHPGPPAPAPGTLAADAHSSVVEEHRERTQVYEAQNRRIDAFTRAAGDAAEIRTKETNAASAWSDLVGDKQNRKLGFTAVGFGLDVVAGEATLRGKKHRARATELSGMAKGLNSARPGLATLDERLALSRVNRAIIGEAADAQKAWRSSTQLGQTMARANGVLAVGGIAYDIAVRDRPWHEAAISGGASFGASVAAGALVGSAIPIPVVGTVAGATVGAAFGIFTSGAVDNLLEGGGVAESLVAGWDTTEAAGETVFNAAGSIWKALF